MGKRYGILKKNNDEEFIIYYSGTPSSQLIIEKYPDDKLAFYEMIRGMILESYTGDILRYSIYPDDEVYKIPDRFIRYKKLKHLSLNQVKIYDNPILKKIK